MNAVLTFPSLYDTVLSRIAGFLCADKSALYALCLVNKVVNAIAGQFLYSKICITSQSDVDALRNFSNRQLEGYPRDAISSSSLPRNATYVQSLEVTAVINPGPNQRTVVQSLETLLTTYTNLRSFTWCPSFCDAELTLGIMRFLPRLVALERLSIKVPFLLPSMPVASSPSVPAKNLNVIAEEDEEHNGDDGASTLAHHGEGENDLQSEPEDPDSYEYKPLEDDSDGVSLLNLSLPCSIPPRELTRLQRLVLLSPTTEVLLPLPDILRVLERPILMLCFEANCGSVTPATLSSLLPVLQQVKHFGLGITYSVKYDELFAFLEGLPSLRELELFHYYQLYKRKTPFAHLRSLKALKIRHAHTSERQFSVNMCVWVRRIISSSRLEEIEIHCDKPDDCPPRGPGHGISYDDLVGHLLARHRMSLRVFKVPGAYLGKHAMMKLFGREGKGCEALEEIEVCVRRQVFDCLSELLDSLPSLRSVRLTVINLRKVTPLSLDKNILREGTTCLRRVVVNGHGLTGEWTIEVDFEEENQKKLKSKAVFRISEEGS